jgi:hypothetical protein
MFGRYANLTLLVKEMKSAPGINNIWPVRSVETSTDIVSLTKLPFLGLTPDRQQALSELRGESASNDGGPIADASNVSDVADMDWETIPAHIQQDETFAHAYRDIIGTQ